MPTSSPSVPYPHLSLKSNHIATLPQIIPLHPMYYHIVDHKILGGGAECSSQDATMHTFAILLGRHSSCTFILSDPDKLLSRRHCLISYISGRYYLNDCGSLNKTVLNGKVVQFEALRTGDVIVFAAGMNTNSRASLDIPFDEDFIENVRRLSDKCIIYEVNLEWGEKEGKQFASAQTAALSPSASTMSAAPTSVGEKRKRQSFSSTIDLTDTHPPAKRRKLDDISSTSSPTSNPSRQKKHHEDKLRHTESRLSVALDEITAKDNRIASLEQATQVLQSDVVKLEQQTHMLQNALRDSQEVKSNMQRNMQGLQEKLKALSQRATPEQLKQQLTEIVQHEMTCSVCQHVFLDPVTLGCSHTYCKGCLVSWIHARVDSCEACLCPLCRLHVGNQPPMRNIVLESLMEKILNFLAHPDIEYNMNRLNELKDFEKDAESQLEKLISLAKQNASHFMSINEEWSDEAKKIFLQGVRSYTGSARIKYCELVGINEDWIQTASLKQMRTACKNLGLREPYRRSPKDPSILQLFEEDLRRLLHEYTKNELLSQIPFLSA